MKAAREELRCSFCNKRQDAVRKLIAGPKVFICDECVEVWMQLEWRALRRAIESSGGDRAEAIADARAFRRERRRLFPGAADNERRDEIREGLASYTGIAAWANSPSDARRAAASALGGVDAETSLVGNYEGASGPAYGVLLDDLLPGWRRPLSSHNAEASSRRITTGIRYGS